MKPTQIECSKGSFNQIPAETTVHGDIRHALSTLACASCCLSTMVFSAELRVALCNSLVCASRLSPFYEVEDVVEHIEQYVKDRMSALLQMQLRVLVIQFSQIHVISSKLPRLAPASLILKDLNDELGDLQTHNRGRYARRVPDSCLQATTINQTNSPQRVQEGDSHRSSLQVWTVVVVYFAQKAKDDLSDGFAG